LPNANDIISHGCHQQPRKRLEDRHDPGSRHRRLLDSISIIPKVLSKQSVPTRPTRFNSENPTAIILP
jgi:hypothetical protein